jgi:hypothetical protein
VVHLPRARAQQVLVLSAEAQGTITASAGLRPAAASRRLAAASGGGGCAGTQRTRSLPFSEQKVKKANGQIVACNEIFEPEPTVRPARRPKP